MVELNEEDPSAFGAGHLVLYRADDKTRRFAITERTDKPEDDDTREVIGWHWCAERYQAFAQLRHYVLSKGFDAVGIIAEACEFEQYPAWNFRAASF